MYFSMSKVRMEVNVGGVGKSVLAKMELAYTSSLETLSKCLVYYRQMFHLPNQVYSVLCA